MLKKLSVIFGALFILCVVTGPVFAQMGPSTQAGKSNIAHLYLYEKNPADWTIVQGGAWGKMKYNLTGSKFDFVFNGHRLEPGWRYTLIYYPDPWPGTGLMCLGTGMADEYGNINIKNKVNTGNLPADTDGNYPDGAKIWLVVSGDVSCGENDLGYRMWGWNPTEYLFEYKLITFTDTDPDPVVPE